MSASKARKAFDASAKDVEALLRIHNEKAGDAAGRKYGLEVLNKSAIVLITAIWEAYIEDITSEALSHLVSKCNNSTQLPLQLRKMISKELKDDKNDLSVWAIADNQWRPLLVNRLDVLKAKRDFHWNTPKSENVDKFILENIGLPSVSDSWKWKNMTAAKARLKIDALNSLRGSIAHRNSPLQPVQKVDVENYFDFVKTLAAKTGGKINVFLTNTTGSGIL